MSLFFSFLDLNGIKSILKQFIEAVQEDAEYFVKHQKLQRAHRCLSMAVTACYVLLDPTDCSTVINQELAALYAQRSDVCAALGQIDKAISDASFCTTISKINIEVKCILIFLL